jgi:hypothetical protein
MKVTILQLWVSRLSLVKLDYVEFSGSKKFDVLTFMESVNDELKKLEKVRVELIKKYGKADEDNPDKVGIPNDDIDNLKKFSEEFSEVLKKEIKLPSLEITKEELMNANLASSDLRALGFLMKKEKKEPKKKSVEPKEE